MNEKPILFKEEMIRAILAGNKTQTRRIVNPQPESDVDVVENTGGNLWYFYNKEKAKLNYPQYINMRKCPYGIPGDELWIRETWKIQSFMEGEPIEFLYKDGKVMDEHELERWQWSKYEEWHERVTMKATNELVESDLEPDDDSGNFLWTGKESPLKWHPSIFLPRWGSRIQSGVDNIRVERVQDISEEDAKAEGVSLDDYQYTSFPVEGERVETYKEGFEILWDKINKKRGFGWDENPWVWTVDMNNIKDSSNER